MVHFPVDSNVGYSGAALYRIEYGSTAPICGKRDMFAHICCGEPHHSGHHVLFTMQERRQYQHRVILVVDMTGHKAETEA